jgi:hypothetical protein
MLAALRSGDDSPEAFMALWRAWGNPYSMHSLGLQRIYAEALAASSPILEMGSGLSSVVLGLAAQKSGVPVIALEESQEHADRTRDFLQHELIHTVQVHTAPLIDGWYDLPDDLPEQFGLVVIDGPQADLRQRGQIYQRIGDRIKTATVIADDTRIHAIARPFDKWVLDSQRRAERFSHFSASRPT